MSRRDIDRPVQAKGVVHELVAETAKGMAAAVYEVCATESDAFYKMWPSIEVFIARRWHSFIQPARVQLAELLNADRASLTTEAQKREIYEALLLNAAVNPAQNAVDKLILPN